MNRKPELDWWPKPLDAPKVSLPSTDAELRELADEMAEEAETKETALSADLIDMRKRMVGFMNTPMQQHQFIPGSREPNLMGDLDAATTITITMRPADFLQLSQNQELIRKAENVMMQMHGGDIWLMKDRRMRTPSLISQGPKSWSHHKSKGRNNGR